MDQLSIEDLNVSENLQPTNDLVLVPDDTSILPAPPLPDEIFDGDWQNLSVNDFRIRTARLNDFVQANQNHPLYHILHFTCMALSHQMNLVRVHDLNGPRVTDDALWQEIFSTEAVEDLRRSLRLIQIAIEISLGASRDFAVFHYGDIL